MKSYLTRGGMIYNISSIVILELTPQLKKMFEKLFNKWVIEANVILWIVSYNTCQDITSPYHALSLCLQVFVW